VPAQWSGGARDGVVAELLRGGTVLADTAARPDVHRSGLATGGVLPVE
jgi:hypothetical protein